MKIKGYVVRGKDEHGATVYAVGLGEWLRGNASPPLFATWQAAAGARADLEYDNCIDVRIYAVAEDGTETPLPPYDDALAQLEDQAARIRFLEERAGVADREIARLRAQKEGIARQRDESLSENEKLRGQRDAFRDHLGLAYRNAYTERAAWARLVRAEQVHHAQTVLLGERDDDAKGAYAEVVAARQALCDLGVDVGSQLGEGPAS